MFLYLCFITFTLHSVHSLTQAPRSGLQGTSSRPARRGKLQSLLCVLLLLHVSNAMPNYMWDTSPFVTPHVSNAMPAVSIHVAADLPSASVDCYKLPSELPAIRTTSYVHLFSILLCFVYSQVPDQFKQYMEMHGIRPNKA